MPPELIQALMSDPELMAAMSNPSIQAKLMECMQNPARMAEYAASDPAIGRIMTKLMGVMGGGGMGGGMGGGFGGMGGAPPSSGVSFEDIDDDDDEPPPLVNAQGAKVTSVDDVD